jgi:hypothetical protein
VTLNTSTGNTADGFTIEGQNHTVTKNAAKYNGDFGIFDAAGNGTTSTYKSNGCVGSGIAPTTVTGPPPAC